MADIIEVPWTWEQVEALNEYQAAGKMHPYTCGHEDCTKVLLATPSGWICPDSDHEYKQFWAYAMSLEEWVRKPWTRDDEAFS